MKKVFVILLTLTLLFSLSSIVSAEDVSGLSSSSQHLSSGGTPIEVLYQVSQGYTVMIPVEVYFNDHTVPVENEVTVTNSIIEHGKSLVVSVTSQYDWKLALFKNGGYDVNAGALTYTMKYSTTNDGAADNTASTSQTAIITLPSGTNDWVCNLVFTLTDSVEVAGNYKDILTFTAAVV